MVGGRVLYKVVTDQTLGGPEKGRLILMNILIIH